jgi:hypothetical protein
MAQRVPRRCKDQFVLLVYLDEMVSCVGGWSRRSMERETVACETIDSEFSQRAMDPRRTPQEILFAHPDYKRADHATDPWASAAPAAT